VTFHTVNTLLTTSYN